MSPLTAFPDIESAVMELLADLATNGTVAPSDLTAPFNRITRYGGADNFITDTARVDVDSFAPTRQVAYALAESVRQRMLGFPWVLTNAVIDRVSTDAGPHEVAWGDPNVRRFTTAFQVLTRRHQ